MEERHRFIAEYRDGLDTMTELCARYGISRQTGYTWAARYEAEGLTGLLERSRRPHTSPSATPDAVVAALVAARRRHPHWGPKKLLGDRWEGGPLGYSTASKLLKREGLVATPGRRRRAPHPGRPQTAATAPNTIWTIDFKGQFRTGDGTLCYPLTVIDSCSRYVLACRALESVRTAPTRVAMERVFREFGLPMRIRSDNGVPFATAWAVAGLSPLSVWWIRLGIVPERIQPGCPAQNGRHERFHRTLKAETTRPPARTRAGQQQRFGRFCREFNTVRPHEALGQRPPATLYVPSPRPYPARVPTLEYAAHLDARRVLPSGDISWRGRRITISHVLIGEHVGVVEVDEGRWAVYFGPVLLGHIDERRRSIEHLIPFTKGRDAAPSREHPASAQAASRLQDVHSTHDSNAKKR